MRAAHALHTRCTYPGAVHTQALGLAGIGAEQEELGTNTIYFGDEVVMHGNDLCVADIPGILVFAVNHRRL